MEKRRQNSAAATSSRTCRHHARAACGVSARQLHEFCDKFSERAAGVCRSNRRRLLLNTKTFLRRGHNDEPTTLNVFLEMLPSMPKLDSLELRLEIIPFLPSYVATYTCFLLFASLDYFPSFLLYFFIHFDGFSTSQDLFLPLGFLLRIHQSQIAIAFHFFVSSKRPQTCLACDLKYFSSVYFVAGVLLWFLFFV
jgi:hypothetical protein